MIEDRPACVEDRKEVGHYEGDTVHGASWETACVVTVVERVTGLLLVGKSPDKTVQSVNKVLIKLLRESPVPVHTLTLDNGTEFHGYRKVEKATGVQIYFAQPHQPWQRGSNENTNGLLRQYFPKGTDLSRWSADELEAVALALNNRPRKVLGWKTPAEVFAEQLHSHPQLGVATTD